MQALALIGSPWLQKVISRHLSFLSGGVTFVTSADSADLLYKRGDFSVFLFERFLDGNVEGLKLCQKFDAYPAALTTSNILFVSTGNLDTDLITEAKEAGVDKIVNKSDLAELSDYVMSLESSSRTSKFVKGHVLLVEDSNMVVQVIITSLEAIGLIVSVYPTAEAALERLKITNFDLIITDFELEGQLTGLGLVRSIRATKAYDKTPILAISGNIDNAKKIELLTNGANDFVAKPLLEEELVARVRNLVHVKRLHDDADAQSEALRKLALTDQLTGLYNRHYMSDIANKRLTEAIKHNVPLSLIVLDLDLFKKVNDTYGHDVGDIVLIEVGRVLSGVCTKSDIASRAGGEEFVLLLINRDTENATAFAENLREEIENLIPNDIPITASIGVSVLPKGYTSNYKELFKVADDGVYTAKASGRNKVIVTEVTTKKKNS